VVAWCLQLSEYVVPVGIMELSAYALQPLREDEEFILYRGRPIQADASSVLLLAPTLRHPALETLEKINHEYALGSKLDQPRQFGPAIYPNTTGKRSLCLEDPGGDPIGSEALKGRTRSRPCISAVSSSAMKEMGNPGRLTIATRRDEKRQLLVSVTGTGVGLPPGHAEQIFNTFFTSNPKAPVWDCRSADRLLNRTAAGYGPAPTPGRARRCTLVCVTGRRSGR
jgi:hypothetical protein